MDQTLQRDLLKQEHEMMQRDLKHKVTSFSDAASIWFLLPFKVLQTARESKYANTSDKERYAY